MMATSVYVFNPFAEGIIARGKAFTPVKHQAMLAEDLANLPQFLCEPEDIVLMEKRPSEEFLDSLRKAGFQPPEFVEVKAGRIDPAAGIWQRKFDRLRPWAWAPDSIELFEPLFGRAVGEARGAGEFFNDGIAQLYSKVWGAGILRKVLAHHSEGHEISPVSDGVFDQGTDKVSDKVSDKVTDKVTDKVLDKVLDKVRGEVADEAEGEHGAWLCSEQEAGVAVGTFKDVIEAIAAIRSRGHHRVVVKEAYGAAGQNCIRLWEPEILPAQRQWLAHALEHGQSLVVEPWLERALDFSVQLEMEPGGLKVCGYTGLVNDRKGQFLANWAEADYAQCLPANVATLIHAQAQNSGNLHRLYAEIFALLGPELRRVGFLGPVSIDAMVYRTPQGYCRLKPVVEINPRYTMGRVTVELMKNVCPGSCGRFRLVTRSQASKEGFGGLSSYARALRERCPPQLERGAKIRRGTVCLNDPERAQVVLATFEVAPALDFSTGN